MEILTGYEVSRLFRRHFDPVARFDPKGNFATKIENFFVFVSNV